MNPVIENVQLVMMIAKPLGWPLASLILTMHCALMEHPLDVAGHDPRTPGRVTLWSGPAPVIVTVPVRPAGVTQLPTDDDDDAVSVSE